ncbi:hypothetical protein BDDG_10027, partial [Blastomyces dermatitidis ATCC 18188]
RQFQSGLDIIFDRLVRDHDHVFPLNWQGNSTRDRTLKGLAKVLPQYSGVVVRIKPTQQPRI